MKTKVLVFILLFASFSPFYHEADYLRNNDLFETSGSTPPSSDYVHAMTIQISNGAAITQLIEHNGSYIALATHQGNGQIGSQSWTSSSSSHALIHILQNGTVLSPYLFTPYPGATIHSTNSGVLIVGNDSGVVNLSILDVNGTISASM